MTTRESLMAAMAAIKQANHSHNSDERIDAETLAWNVVREYGPALLAALDDAERFAKLVAWLDNNTTFYDVDADWPVEAPNVPVLAQVSNRIWYHATDDCTSYPFSAVAKAAMGETQPIAPAIDAARKA